MIKEGQKLQLKNGQEFDAEDILRSEAVNFATATLIAYMNNDELFAVARDVYKRGGQLSLALLMDRTYEIFKEATEDVPLLVRQIKVVDNEIKAEAKERIE